MKASRAFTNVLQKHGQHFRGKTTKARTSLPWNQAIDPSDQTSAAVFASSVTETEPA